MSINYSHGVKLGEEELSSELVDMVKRILLTIMIKFFIDKNLHFKSS